MIYLDHHATTPLDPTALEAMLPLLKEQFANPGSITHEAGRHVAQMVTNAANQIAASIGADEDELVFTSGATESNNLALFGTLLHPRQKRKKIVSVCTEHKALLDPLVRLQKQGFEVSLVSVQSDGGTETAVGMVDLEQLERAIDEETAIVSVMLANNEIGTIQPLRKIADLCHAKGAYLHTDAAQAVGRLRVNVDELDVDLMSFSGHKFYGPKGVGGLFVRSRQRRVRLQSQIVGGGQQRNMRSGTLNAPGIVGMSAALAACLRSLEEDSARICRLRDQLWNGLVGRVEQVQLNGPLLETEWRLPGNLSCNFFPLEGQSLMLEAPDVAVSSGSACTSAEPSPSHVLTSVGLSEEQARSSLRFGVGRFTTDEEIDSAVERLSAAATKLAKLS